jgi:hypothetical protein
VNLFIPSELTATNLGLTLRQETTFPDEPRTRLVMKLKKSAKFTLHLRHPSWVASNEFAVRINGKPVKIESTPSSYATLNRDWHDGDRVEIELPMHTTVERLPDDSNWVALLRGPIVLARPAGTNGMDGLYADDSRMGHVAHGPAVPLDHVPVLLASANDLPLHVKPDTAAGPLRFRLDDVVEPATSEGLPLMPFFRLHDARYQMYWELTTKETFAARRERIAAEERARAEREANTIDFVAPGEQQPEVEHNFSGGKTETGLRDDRRWRRGDWFQYVFNARSEKTVELSVTYWGGEQGRAFEIFANDTLLASEELNAEKPGKYLEKHYVIPVNVLSSAVDGGVIVKFSAKPGSGVGSVFDVRLMRSPNP